MREPNLKTSGQTDHPRVQVKVSDFPCKNILYLDYEEPTSPPRIVGNPAKLAPACAISELYIENAPTN